ncbi:uncharacterized protein TRIADDRAFT_61091 [Trichoplax adhaerens]|uniref:Uncharacterized protein n=1 Tax=Trichoplax adhaerens TaxID=10228 RepID=B3SA06_TRIAD|nr:hypothetical protein TRIADDRAFT_61091 [Trichoplax adhaerens]EDV20357.1 hypothetical protein TRIADDRAFT_61091 [Trichoplax adhaerens]|eukprot:XP_002117051.1 hypothetical protein TRIADDRAFT_61091 [Trichoplax adhaerens]
MKLPSLNTRSVDSKDNQGTPVKLISLRSVGVGSLVGFCTFPATLGTLQIVLFSPLRLSCSIPVVSSVSGTLAVATSVTVASIASISASLFYQRLENSLATKKDTRKEISLRYSFSPVDLGFYTVAAGITFKIAGGRFKSVLPSSFFKAGAFAHSCIPAKGQMYATKKEKWLLTSLGRKYGCHTCGSRRSKFYFGDHIPPNTLLRKGEQQVFYPQCNQCSSLQGGLLSGNKSNFKLKTHALSLRLYHLYLPFPFILMAIRQFAI